MTYTEKRQGGDKKRKENRFRAYFLRLFDKWNFRDEQAFIRFAKWLIFACFIVVEAFLILDYTQSFQWGDERTIGFFVLLGVAATLLVCEGIKLFVVRGRRWQLFFFIVDMVAAFAFMVWCNGAYAVAVYALVLTEFYIVTDRASTSFGALFGGVALYLGGYLLQSLVVNRESVNLYALLTSAFGGMLALLLHFVVVQIAIAFYRQFLRLDRALAELNESKKELEKAYAVVAEVTALEERQRIAKEIHDTAGHSITTVIMQTEAAKLIVEQNPTDAKNKIVAANIQAKHALEELRDSVHLLSGVKENETLRQAFLDIIHDSTDGTGITIRSEIEDVTVSPAKFRFLCNTLKEGISNGLRHGGATAFWFECKSEDGKIRFLLSDNGKGVGEEGLHIGFGLSSMRERARALGGEVHFSSEAEEGFELSVSLPTDAE